MSAFPDLRAFIERLRRDDDLVTVDAPVDPNLEVAEIHRRVIAAGGPALLFTNVTGSGFRLVTNLFGTARRAELAFGERPLRLIRRGVEVGEAMASPRPGLGAPAPPSVSPSRRARRDDAAPEAGQAVGRARRRSRAAESRHEARH